MRSRAIATAGAIVALPTIVFAACSWCTSRRLRRDGVHAMAESTSTPDDGSLDDAPSERWRRPPSAALGRALDLAGACVAIVVLAPLMVAIAVAVKLGDGGPVLFVQERIGRDGRTFRMRKFRTMIVDAELHPIDDLDEHGRSRGPLFNVAHDPRATRVGHVLRRTGLDELPQLFDVLAGTMSLVGPRPALPDEVTAFDAGLRRRETVLPGVTGLWQVLARDNPSLHVYRRLDLYYVDHRCVAGDVAILCWTIRQVVVRCAGLRPAATIPSCRLLRTALPGRRGRSAARQATARSDP